MSHAQFSISHTKPNHKKNTIIQTYSVRHEKIKCTRTHQAMTASKIQLNLGQTIRCVCLCAADNRTKRHANRDLLFLMCNGAPCSEQTTDDDGTQEHEPNKSHCPHDCQQFHLPSPNSKKKTAHFSQVLYVFFFSFLFFLP